MEKQILEQVVNKYSAQPRIVELLEKYIPDIVKYYGNEYEELIINTLSDINIYIVEDGKTIYDIVKNHEEENNIKCLGNNIVRDGDLKRASGVSSNLPKLTWKGSKPKIEGCSRIIALRDYQNIESEANFVHEFCHAIKSYENTFDIDNNGLLIERSGLLESKYRIQQVGDITEMECISEKNLGIEEGINSYDEKNIMERVNNQPYKISGYAFETEVAKAINENLKLENIIKQAQLFPKTVDVSEEYNKVFSDDTNHWESMNSLFDEELKLTYDRFGNVFNQDEWKKANDNKYLLIRNQLIQELLDYKNLDIPKKEDNEEPCI